MGSSMNISAAEAQDNLRSQFCEIMIKNCKTQCNYNIFNDIEQLISAVKIAIISHEDRIKILDNVIREFIEYCPNKIFQLDLYYFDKFNAAIFDSNLTYSHLLMYNKILSKINFIIKQNIRMYRVYDKHYCLYIPTTDPCIFPRITKIDFMYIALTLADEYKKIKYQGQKTSSITDIERTMLEKGMEYFNYPEELRGYITNPISPYQYLVMFYVDDYLYYDGVMVKKHIDTISKDRMISCDKLHLSIIKIEMEKYSDHINVSYRYYCDINYFPIGGYFHANKVKLSGFVDRKKKINIYNQCKLSFNKYIIPLELPWKDDDGGEKQWNHFKNE